jgi:hypothetical protein
MGRPLFCHFPIGPDMISLGVFTVIDLWYNMTFCQTQGGW